MKTYAKLLAVALALSAIPLLYACDSPTEVRPVTVSPAYAKIYVGQMVQLTATLNGTTEPVADREIQWSSIDASIAEVSNNGWVLGLKPGRATIVGGCGRYCGTALVVVSADIPGPGDADEPPPGDGR